MCEFCEKNKRPSELSQGDILKIFVQTESGEYKCEGNGRLLNKLPSWYRPEPYADFVCPKSVSESNRRLGKEEGTFVMSIKEKWLVELLDMPNCPRVPRWIPKHHSIGIVHVADLLDEDDYLIERVSLEGRQYKVSYDYGICINSLVIDDHEIRFWEDYILWESLKKIKPSILNIETATCVNLGKSFSVGDQVVSDIGPMEIMYMKYINGSVYAYGHLDRVRKIELCDLEHVLVDFSWDLDI